jgi:hypothetical protein
MPGLRGSGPAGTTGWAATGAGAGRHGGGDLRKRSLERAGAGGVTAPRARRPGRILGQPNPGGDPCTSPASPAAATRRTPRRSSRCRTSPPRSAGTRALDQARRPARPRRRRQQDAQARVPGRRRAGAGRRHADHRRRGAVEPLPPDARRRRREGLKCQLVLEERVPGSYREDASGNNLLFGLLGVERIEVVDAGTDLARRDAGPGRRPGGAGAQGVRHPRRRLERARRAGLRRLRRGDHGPVLRAGRRLRPLVASSGSGGTHAGLWPACTASAPTCRSRGSACARAQGAAGGEDPRPGAGGRRPAGRATPVPRERSRSVDDYVGPGYSLPTASMVEAVQLFARHEGILLDPVYTGKTAAGLIGMVRAGPLREGRAGAVPAHRRRAGAVRLPGRRPGPHRRRRHERAPGRRRDRRHGPRRDRRLLRQAGGRHPRRARPGPPADRDRQRPGVPDRTAAIEGRGESPAPRLARWRAAWWRRGRSCW